MCITSQTNEEQHSSLRGVIADIIRNHDEHCEKTELCTSTAEKVKVQNAQQDPSTGDKPSHNQVDVLPDVKPNLDSITQNVAEKESRKAKCNRNVAMKGEKHGPSNKMKRLKRGKKAHNGPNDLSNDLETSSRELRSSSMDNKGMESAETRNAEIEENIKKFSKKNRKWRHAREGKRKGESREKVERVGSFEYKCHVCNLQYERVLNLLRHMLEHTNISAIAHTFIISVQDKQTKKAMMKNTKPIVIKPLQDQNVENGSRTDDLNAENKEITEVKVEPKIEFNETEGNKDEWEEKMEEEIQADEDADYEPPKSKNRKRKLAGSDEDSGEDDEEEDEEGGSSPRKKNKRGRPRGPAKSGDRLPKQPRYTCYRCTAIDHVISLFEFTI